MATNAEAKQALTDAIAEMAPRVNNARALRVLAEAYAWVTYPNNSHGGTSDSSAS